ncbi:MAG: glycoside hydrolase family 3 C-terminal domain-containing protein, partial [Deltaproteobacteria bacterium]|nr:glycoside hydrolase family 3 C-terminal domain-containing protein [Deltaproteobacteria bacterium]
ADHHAEAAAIVAEMTLAEKLGCLDGDTIAWPGLIDMGSGGYHRHTWPAARVERLGVPGLDFSDGPRGCVIAPATVFPVSMARAASFDPDLERRVGDAIGAELRASGATYTGAVCMNLLRHPAWGRAQETYGEDPHHVGEMAAAFTAGLQQHVMACMKHFALNSMENARFKVDVTADERALHEVYLPHFRRVVEAGVASVMSAYNSLNGEWCGENRTLLIEILREEWGFDGFVTSDFIAGLRDPVKSVGAGLNIEMPFRQQRALALGDALESGALDSADVEARATETIATFLRFAYVYDRQPSKTVVACTPHRALAREAAVASMVLLCNEGPLLPLERTGLAKVAVLGRLADIPNLGDNGSSSVLQPEVVTPLAGIRAALRGIEVVHSESDATIARDADLVLVVVGYTAEHEGEYIGQSGMSDFGALLPPGDHPELGLPKDFAPPPTDGAAARPVGSIGTTEGGDRRSLRLPPEDEALIAAAAAVSDRVVVAVMGGSAVVMPWLGDVAAVLMLWYPGMEGGHALADVLLGAEPGGRLPFAVPVDERDLVAFDPDATTATYGLLHGQWWLDHQGVAAQRPFGYGLGYTTFAIASAERVGATLRVVVRNTGGRAGSTVLQVYGSVPDSEYERPPQRLIGFRRVEAPRGAVTEVEIPLDFAQLDVRVEGKWLRENTAPRWRVALHAGDPGLVGA